MLRPDLHKKAITACSINKQGLVKIIYSCNWYNGYSLVPRPSHCLAFDCLQYAKAEGEGLVHFITRITSVSTVYLGCLPRQIEGGRGSQSKDEAWMQFLSQALEFRTSKKRKTYRSWFKTSNACAECILLIGDPSFPLSIHRYTLTSFTW